jgi:Family of unknown function (DUF6221)
MSMDGLAAFLATRLDEVEFHACEGLGWQTGSRYEGQPAGWVAYLRTAASPDFALAQVAAGRAILVVWQAAEARRLGDEPEYAYGYADGKADGLLIAVRHAAAVFERAPDYRAEWAVEA